MIKHNAFRLIHKGISTLATQGPTCFILKTAGYVRKKVSKFSHEEEQNPLNKKTEFEVGINIAGYFNTESGVGEMGRGLVRCIKETDTKFTLNNFALSPSRKEDHTYLELYSDNNPFWINLIAVNAEQVEVFYNHKGYHYFKGKYNIGYWAWELASFPKEWCCYFKYLDEIWTLSTFAADSISKASNNPVITIPPSIKINSKRRFGREHFDIPKNKFIFLFIFDFYSIFERKNPLGLIDAFSNAFTKKDNAMLVIKCSNSSADKSNFEMMKYKCNGLPIKIIDKYITRSEIYDLMRCSDCYVSLHRSEGFGLTIAEMMYLGKPVIATNYSGNTDFMNINNSYPVKYRLVKLKKEYKPYKKGGVWAEPDITHATELMRYAYNRQDEATKLGQKGKRDVMEQLSPKRIGNLIKERIEKIIEFRKI